MWDVVLLLLVPFRSQIFDAFLTSFWTYSHFPLFKCNFCRCLCSKVFNLHLFCVISMFVSEKNAYVKDFNALRILMIFLCIY